MYSSMLKIHRKYSIKEKLRNYQGKREGKNRNLKVIKCSPQRKHLFDQVYFFKWPFWAVLLLLMLYFISIFFLIFKEFLATLSLCCCAQAFSSCGGWGLLSSCGGFSCCRTWTLERGFSSFDAQAYQVPCGMWNLPGPGIKPMSPALAGRFLTSGPPGKSSSVPLCLSGKKKLVSTESEQHHTSNAG